MSAALPLYLIAKRCYLCGHEWAGHSFVPQPAGAASLPGTCAACLAQAEAADRAVLRWPRGAAPKADPSEAPLPPLFVPPTSDPTDDFDRRL